MKPSRKRRCDVCSCRVVTDSPLVTFRAVAFDVTRLKLPVVVCGACLRAGLEVIAPDNGVTP